MARRGDPAVPRRRAQSVGIGATTRHPRRAVRGGRTIPRDDFPAGEGVQRSAGGPSVERAFLLEKQVGGYNNRGGFTLLVEVLPLVWSACSLHRLGRVRVCGAVRFTGDFGRMLACVGFAQTPFSHHHPARRPCRRGFWLQISRLLEQGLRSGGR